MSTITERISEELQNGKMKLVKELITEALEKGESAKVILEDGLMAGMNVIAVKFKNN